MFDRVCSAIGPKLRLETAEDAKTFYTNVKPFIGLTKAYRRASAGVYAETVCFCAPKIANSFVRWRRISSTERSMKLLVRGGSMRRVG
jgi:hypothetical protein